MYYLRQITLHHFLFPEPVIIKLVLYFLLHDSIVFFYQGLVLANIIRCFRHRLVSLETYVDPNLQKYLATNCVNTKNCDILDF